MLDFSDQYTLGVVGSLGDSVLCTAGANRHRRLVDFQCAASVILAREPLIYRLRCQSCVEIRLKMLMYSHIHCAFSPNFALPCLPRLINQRFPRWPGFANGFCRYVVIVVALSLHKLQQKPQQMRNLRNLWEHPHHK